jgi:acetolactate synthase-1/2/3 large subunit
MNTAEIVGRTLAVLRVGHAFGVVGSGNFHVTNALVAAGVPFTPAAHEGGAATMADAYARVSGRVAVLTVHQGPGVTNSLTGIAEAAKSHTPLIVLAPAATAPRSNFFIDLEAAARAVGADYLAVRSERAADDAGRAHRLADSGRCVVLGLALEVQAAEGNRYMSPPSPPKPLPRPEVGPLVEVLRSARRPVFIAGRGALRDPNAGPAIAALADRCGALLAVSAVAKGLFEGDPWNLGISGGFATPLAVELIGAADLVVAFGSTLNMWTTRHGRILPAGGTVAQVDLDPAAIGVNRPVDVGITGDVAVVARLAAEQLSTQDGWRTLSVRARIAAEGHWRSTVDESRDGRSDPRALSTLLDDMLPVERTVAVDSGNFMGYPSAYLRVPDAAGFCFTQAYQSVGLGLATALGAAVARPDRLTVAALGDGGFLMGAAELVTAVRLGLPLVAVVYNDAAYGAEVHHFGPDGFVLDTVTFPDTDLAAIAKGYGCEAFTVRGPADLAPLRDWLAGPRTTPLVIDAKVVRDKGSWWLEEAFRGH